MTAPADRRSAPDPVRAVNLAFDAMSAARAGSDGLNAVLWSDQKHARDEARAVADNLEGGGIPGPLAGVPVAVKDNIATLHLPTTCASRILEGYVSPYEATVVSRIRRAGGIVIAKTNCDEFAMGSSSEHSAYGPVRHPMDPTRVPGGSSGGSAAVVAAGIVPIALGSETGGSVRQPAAFCGIVGVKPTYGRVSRYGLVAFASSLDQVGVFGRTVRDAALGMEVIAGRDPLDATSDACDVPVYREAADRDVRDMVIGKPREYFPDELDPRVARACDRALDRLVDAGATVKDISLPHTSLAIPVYYIIAPAEASSNLAMACGTACAWKATDCARCTTPRGPTASAPKSRAASCSAPTSSPPATTMRTIVRRRRCGPVSRRTSVPRSTAAST
jgi:aspartyl-tRNA(Asn)/glutamyl-tRNA(Gln) amidotransferase subunit A